MRAHMSGIARIRPRVTRVPVVVPTGYPVGSRGTRLPRPPRPLLRALHPVATRIPSSRTSRTSRTRFYSSIEYSNL